MFVCSAFLKNIFKYFQHVFNTVSSQNTVILQELFYDYQINLENTANLTAVFEAGDIQNFWEWGRNLYRGTQHFMVGLNNPLETIQPVHGYFTYQRQKSTITLFLVVFVSEIIYFKEGFKTSSNRNQSSTKVKARMFFIVIPYDLVMSICHCTNPISFLMFPVLD